MIANNYFTNIELTSVPFNTFTLQPTRFHSPPTNFNGLPLHPELQNMQGNFVTAILNEAASKAQTTPGRLYQWNLFCSNNFQNKELMDTVILAANYTALGMAKNVYQNLDQAAQASIQYVIEARGAYITACYPDLLRQYPVENQQTINRAAQEYSQMAGEVVNYINTVVYRSNNTSFNGGFNQQHQQQQQYQQYQQPQSAFGSPFSGNQRNMGNMNSYNNQPRRNNLADPFTNRSSTTPQFNASNTGILTTGNMANTGEVDVEGMMKILPPKDMKRLLDKHAQKMEAEKLQTSQPIQQQTPAQDFPFAEITPEGKLIWSRTTEQQYPTAANTEKSRQRLVLRNGEVYCEVQPKSVKEIEMDRAAHRTGTIEASIERSTPFKVLNKTITDRSDYMKTSLDTVAETHDIAFNADEKTFKENLNEYFLTGYTLLEEPETSMEDAVHHTREMNALSSNVNQLGAHRADFDLAHKFVFPKSEQPEFERLLKVTNLEQLAAKLKALLLDDTRSVKFNNVLIQLDSYIKKHVLHVVRNELGLSQYNDIDTFVDDYSDLMESLKEDGEQYYEIFKRQERAFIARFLTLSKTVEVIGTEANEMAVCSLLVRSSVTVVDFLYSEINVEMIPNVSNIVLKDQFPKIYNFLDELVSNDYLKDTDVYYGSHWMVTADNVVIQIHRSALNNSTILITKT